MKSFCVVTVYTVYDFISFISIQLVIHVTLDTSKYNTGQHTVLSH